MKASDNPYPSILITEGTEPTAPAAGKQRLYVDSTSHKLKRTDSSGTDVTVEPPQSLDTSDSPQFTAINLGHASDTTLSRVSAGVVAIEGTNIVKAGGATGSGLTMATARLLGRTTASTGAIEEITVGSGLSLSAGALTATGGGAAAFKGCRAYHTTTQSISNSTFTAVVFNTDHYDTDAYHDTGSNTSRMTIPAGDGSGHYYRITSRVYVAANGVAPICIFRKNGTDVPGSAAAMRATDTVAIVNTVTLQLDSTDYVECFFIHFNGGSINIGDGTNDENHNSMELHYLG